MRKLFIAVAVIAMAVFAAFAVIGWAGYETFLKTPASDVAAVSVTIHAGDSAKLIGDTLKSDGLLSSVWLFRGYVNLAHAEKNFQAGDYQLTSGMSVASLVHTLTSPSNGEVVVTIPEGFTLAQIGSLVQGKLGISTADWQAVTGVDSPFEGTMSLLKDKPDSVDLEGYLFPDTYRFAKSALAQDIVKKMLDTMSLRLTENASQLGTIKNIHELLTLASIVERESPDDANRGWIASVFQNRLDIGMPLQADSTVNYVTGKKTPGISLDDKETASRYNTYKYPGLPPGPIASPGIASIISAAHPAKSDSFYFLTTPEGKVIYAKTYAEQVANKAKYL